MFLSTIGASKIALLLRFFDMHIMSSFGLPHLLFFLFLFLYIRTPGCVILFMHTPTQLLVSLLLSLLYYGSHFYCYCLSCLYYSGFFDRCCCYCCFCYVINILNIQNLCSSSSITARTNKRLQIRDEWTHGWIQKYVFMPFDDLWAEAQRWSKALVMHVKLVTHQTTRGASGPQNVPTQRFSFSMRRREKAHTEADEGKYKHKHTVALRPWKSADMSAWTRRHSVCGAAERFSCENAGNDTPHPRVTGGQNRAHKRWFIDVRRIGKYN